MPNILDKESVTFILAVVGVVVLLWMLYPVLLKGTKSMTQEESMEKFSSEEEMPHVEAEALIPHMETEAEMPHAETEEMPHKGSQGHLGFAYKPPHVEAETGTIVDGPGFEKGPIEGAYQETPTSIPSNYYFLDDGAGGEMSIQNNLCSKSCCSEQWPTPFKQKYDPYVCQNKNKFVPSRIMCNNTFQDSGCLCLTKRQGEFLYNRGGNGREWF